MLSKYLEAITHKHPMPWNSTASFWWHHEGWIQVTDVNGRNLMPSHLDAIIQKGTPVTVKHSYDKKKALHTIWYSWRNKGNSFKSLVTYSDDDDEEKEMNEEWGI